MNTIQHTSQSEEKVMGSNSNDTINVSDLIRALQGMAVEASGPPTVEETTPDTRDVGSRMDRFHDRLTDKQMSFCELMALGSNKADAYTSSYDVSDPAFSDNDARKLLSQKKIRNKIAEFKSQLGDIPADSLKPDDRRTRRGWTIRLTDKQEKFCQARASGSTIAESYKDSGYYTPGWTEGRVRREGRKLLKLDKIKNRIADLLSGDAAIVEVAKQPRRSPEVPPVEAEPFFNGRTQGAELPELMPQYLQQQNEFVDNFMELIKAHSRLFHHAVVIHGQKAAGLPVETAPHNMEDAVARSIETLRETLLSGCHNYRSKQLGPGGD